MINPRRKRAILFFNSLAAIGAILWIIYPESSALQHFGKLLLFIWLLGFLFVNSWLNLPVKNKSSFATGFDVDTPYSVDITVLAVFSSSPRLSSGLDGQLDFRGFALLGTEAFTLRIWLEDDASQTWAPKIPVVFKGQFLNPANALTRFTAGKQGLLFVGKTVVGSFETITSRNDITV
jgi:hypothetical protein